MAVVIVFLRNIHSSIEILKIKIPEYSYPPSQYFFVTKAFKRLFLSRRKVALCQSGRMAHMLTKFFVKNERAKIKTNTQDVFLDVNTLT